MLVSRITARSSSLIKTSTLPSLSYIPIPKAYSTYPIDESAKTIRHLQFKNRIPFEKGLRIQEKLARVQLDMKDIHSKIQKKLTDLQKEHVNATINENEKKIIDNILAMKPNPIVLTFEFEPTYTGGKRVKKVITKEQMAAFEEFVPLEQKKNPKPKFVQVERGGQITFHGPGQMVAYIIMDLKSFHDYPAKCLVSDIEQATINTLENIPIGEEKLHLKTMRTENTGVWTKTGGKIASLGIHVRRSITTHGVAINVNPDLSYLNSFEMCGLSNAKATSIKDQVPDANITVEDVAITFVKELAKLLGVKRVERMQADDINLDQ
ncbi:hypothetical protein NCAS_0C02820 [Naumovozyma castellii]|uniref:Octanoyltransferase n=1 Tax=Naumovozyma castellii TaxID=27288 RepID=G0VCR2_NAUCA|nr:hypothetical protein NCAS_0C02820 [Naumovozyma castellii CBS 4309]CCC69272.1 hypothetical protein NCAS_0C02820 [Naumovozyma castellii CBS 4309]